MPSWYFGDGAQLANQVVAQTGDPGRIVPLDSVLTSASAGRLSAASLGVRIGHTITRHVLVTLNYDQVTSDIALTSGALAALAATNASFQPFWEPLLTRAATANVKASSALTVADNVSNQERIFSVAAEIRIVTVRGWTPYVAVGGGLAWPANDAPSVTLVGNYRFNVVNTGANNGTLITETDQLKVSYEPLPSPIGIFGVGVERDLGSHFGVRGEGRVFIDANAYKIRLDAQPVTTVGVPPFAIARRGLNPSLEISNNPAQPSSLSLQGVNHFTSFEGTGKLWSYSAGFFVRL